MRISIKQNHLLKLKYALHISETVHRVVVLDTCITIVLQIYTLKLRDSYFIMLKMYPPPPTTGLKLNSKNYICQRQWMMKRTSLRNRVQKISHDMLNSVVNIGRLFNTKRHFKHNFWVTFASKTISLLF